MQTLQRRSDAWLGITLLLSAMVHMAAFLGITWLQGLSPDPGQLQTTYYVDVVNLPVASPQAGSPTPAPDNTDQPQIASAPQAGPMMTPAPTAASDGKGPKKRLTDLSGADGQNWKAKQLSSASQRPWSRYVRRSPAAGPACRAPAAARPAATTPPTCIHGSKDAFRDTIQYQSKTPFVVVRLTIDRDGRVMRTRFEQSNNDKVFEKSVQRAIELAEQRIVPPPGRTTYEGTFVFKPQGVLQR